MIRKPKPATLKKYGLDEVSWALLLQRQRFVCGLCMKEPPSGILVVDHQHVPKWRKMPPQERRRYVRGLACNHCNHRLLGRFMTAPNARRVAEYLDAYEDRKRKEVSGG